VWRLAYHVLRDREEAWDVAQEAFVRAYQALGSFRGQSAFFTWLYRIVMNVAADRARQRAARGRAFGTEPVPEEDWDRFLLEPGETPADRAARGEARERILKALGALSEPHRAIIMLSDVEGLAYREIAEVLNIPIGTVMSRLHNARKKLRGVLGPMLLLLVAVALTVVLGPLTAGAQPIVRFGARVLLATDGPSGTMRGGPPVADERLEAFLPKLRQLFRYSDYTSLERYRAEVPLGATQRWAVPGERQLELTAASADRAVRLRLRLLRGPMTELVTDIQAAPGHPAVIGGPRFADGVLIIIVWANPNPEPR
jgi:RNA polymerase sigma-70 factor (ECF subfamily)